MTIWNQHRYARKYDGHLFRYITYTDLMTILTESGLTERDLTEAHRIMSHIQLGDNSPEIMDGRKKTEETLSKVPIEKLWCACIIDIEYQEAYDYIRKTKRTSEEQIELEAMLNRLSYLGAPSVKPDDPLVTTILSGVVAGIPWVTLDTMTWQQSQVLIPFLIGVANKRQEAMENGGYKFNSQR